MPGTPDGPDRSAIWQSNSIYVFFQSMIALVPPTHGVRSSCPAFDVDGHRTSRITHHAISTALLDGEFGKPE